MVGPATPLVALTPVEARAEVQEAAAALAEAQERLAAASAELAAADRERHQALASASTHWRGGDPPAALRAAHLRRESAESLLEVTSQALRMAEARHQTVTEAGRAASRSEYRAEVQAAERALAAALDQLLLEAGKITTQWRRIHLAAHEHLPERAGAWSMAFPPVSSEQGEVPWLVSRWRAVLRQQGILPPGDDRDWQAITAGLRPAVIVIPVPPSPPLPPELAAQKGAAVIDGDRIVIAGGRPSDRSGLFRER